MDMSLVFCLGFMHVIWLAGYTGRHCIIVSLQSSVLKLDAVTNRVIS